MPTLTVDLSDELFERFRHLADETGRTLPAALQVAVFEFVETWERHLTDLHEMGDEEARAMLSPEEE